MVKHHRQTQTRRHAPLIAVCIHTGLVAAMVGYITYQWMYTNADYLSLNWCFLYVVDAPIVLLWLLAEVALEFTPWSFSVYVEQVVIPALLFAVFGGVQWYYIVRVLSKKRVTTHPTCRDCGYLLVGCTSDRCPDCGAPIPPELATWIRSSSVLSGCTTHEEGDDSSA